MERVVLRPMLNWSPWVPTATFVGGVEPGFELFEGLGQPLEVLAVS